jgi:hypothetical protein
MCHYDFALSDTGTTRQFSPSCIAKNGALTHTSPQCTTPVTINRPASCNDIILGQTLSASGTLSTSVNCSTSYTNSVAIDCGNGAPQIPGSSGVCAYDVRSLPSVGTGVTYTPHCLIDGSATAVPACTKNLVVAQDFDLGIKKYVDTTTQDAQDANSAVSITPESAFLYLMRGHNYGPAQTRAITLIHDIMPTGAYILSAPTGT